MWPALFTRILPGCCLLCGDDAQGIGCHAGQLCDPCHTELPDYPVERCPVCAMPAPGSQRCGACLAHPPHFDATQAVWPYVFPVDGLVQALKFAHRLPVAKLFGAALCLGEPVRRPDLILPVPLSEARLRERGFNQAVEIARPLARRLGVPLEVRGVRRHHHAPAQSTLPWKERRANIRGAFECDIDMSDKAVLVIDDVMTSGSTLDELARLLKGHGANWVENRVLARTLKDAP